MTPENQRDEKPTQADKELAVQLWDELNAPGEENPRIKLAFALAAQRQAWEKEKYDLLTYGANQAELIAKLEKEKAGLEAMRKYLLSPTQNASENVAQYVSRLEERVREYKTEWESALYREQGLKSRNEELERRIVCDECGGTDLVCAKGWREERNRLKAENHRLSLTQNITQCNHYAEGFVPKSEVDALTCALAEAREVLDEVESGLTRRLISGGMETTVAESTGMDETLSDVRKALSNPTSQRASEEMKGLRKVVEVAKFVPRNIVSTDPISIRVVANLKEALEAYESRGKV